MHTNVNQLPPAGETTKYNGKDWLLHPYPTRSSICRGSESGEIHLANGLIRRTFRLSPDCATVGFDNLVTGEALIRGVKPEALVTIAGKQYRVGGLVGQEEYAYLRPEWLAKLRIDPDAFHLQGFEIGSIRERFPWRRRRHHVNMPWPPPGASITFHYILAELAGISISVHYEIYDGLPLIAKWLTIANAGEKPLRLNTFTSEVLAMVEFESVVETRGRFTLTPSLHAESDYAFLGMSPSTANQTTHWEPDPQYTSQVSYMNEGRVQLESRPPFGPEWDIRPGETFETFHTYELAFDSTDRERRGLAVRRLYRTIAPWVTENPIMMHVVTADPAKVHVAIDQCAEVGFDMIIISFGSGLNMEWDDPEFYEEYKELFDYAHAKGVEIGTYSLFSSRSISPEDDVIDPETGKPSTRTAFGKAGCLGSRWGLDYTQKLMTFLEKTGADLLEHDGPYPGDRCASTSHPGHRDLGDSQWAQWRMAIDFYHWCRARGIYINAPDWYHLNGTNKNGMGYKEVNWSLPRERQVIIARQNIFDGTWEKPPSMGWMFTPLTVYHQVGSWRESTLEPLAEHLPFYEAHLAQNFGAGVQSCYRGNRLYDTEETKKIVKKWVDFFKRYREILESDIIHVRRADGRHVDCILHANAQVNPPGLAMVYNPLDQSVQTTLRLPLYYTGLQTTALIAVQEGAPKAYPIDRDYSVEVPINLGANSYTWLVIKEGR